MQTTSLKKEAIKLRKKGKSIREIESALGIARSTLSGWLRNVELSKKQKEELHKRWLHALVKARLKASETNRKNRLNRMKKIEQSVEDFAANITIDKKIEEIIFSIFYLAEGAKGYYGQVAFANTNPEIMVVFLASFRRLYSPEEHRLRCYLHLRMDQSEKKLKDYWSKILDIPRSQFIKTQFDPRSTKRSFKNYKGVCAVYYCDTLFHKRIITIAEKVLQIIKKGG